MSKNQLRLITINVNRLNAPGKRKKMKETEFRHYMYTRNPYFFKKTLEIFGNAKIREAIRCIRQQRKRERGGNIYKRGSET